MCRGQDRHDSSAAWWRFSGDVAETAASITATNHTEWPAFYLVRRAWRYTDQSGRRTRYDWQWQESMVCPDCGIPLEGQQKEPITVEIYSAGRRCTQVLHSGVDFNGFTEVWQKIMHYLINGLYFSIRPQSAIDSHSTALLLFWCAPVYTVAYCYIGPITISIIFIYVLL